MLPSDQEVSRPSRQLARTFGVSSQGRARVVLAAAALCGGMLAGAGGSAMAARFSPGARRGEAGAVPRKANPALEKDADLFLHYSIMGDVKLAHDYGAALLKKKPSDVALLRAFEAAANGRDVSRILIRNQRTKTLRSISVNLFSMLQKGHIALIRNPDRIKQEIIRMAKSPQGYVIARGRLRAAGQYAVPYYIQYLNNPNKQNYQPYVLQMMSDIGRPVLDPLLEELHTKNAAEKAQLVNVIGEIAYPQALPYLKEMSTAKSSPGDLKRSAKLAFARCDPSGRFDRFTAAHLFLNLAYGYFDHASALKPANPNEPTNPIWYYDRGLNNVIGVPVPTKIWSDIEAMRACERALQLKHNYPQAISLWLASDLRREIDLPAGQKDPTHKPSEPNANYYAVAAGPKYLNPALSIALNQRDSSLILRTIHALQETGGVDGLVGFNRGGSGPLMQALAYPDRAVRFAAAFALARANPIHHFRGDFRVVPVLSEALEQTGKPVALVVMKSDQQRNAIKAELKKKFYVIDAPTISAALRQAGHVSAINLAIVPGGVQANHLVIAAQTDYRLQATPVLVLSAAYEVPRYHLQYITQRTFTELPNNSSYTAMMAAYRRTRREIGNTPVNNAKAQRWALASAQLLKRMAENRGSIYNVNGALPALTQALATKQSGIVAAVAGVLGHMDNPKAQTVLAKRALGKARPSARVRRDLFVALADSAKHTGNHLTTKQINHLVRIVAKTRNAKVRNAAARALGALDVKANQASRLIRSQIHK